jgi:hypothetical protein
MRSSLAILLALAAGASAQTEGAGLRPISACGFALEEDPAEWAERAAVVADLGRVLPRVSVAGVVADGNRIGTRIRGAAGVRRVHMGFRWNSGDDRVKYWMPQGISGSAAACRSETVGGKRVLLASWYFKKEKSSSAANKGVRVSFVDATSMRRIRYRHVLLVDPTRDSSGRATFKPVPIHAGGIAWFGRYLYVVDTSKGFRVFDMRRIFRVSTGKKEIIGRSGGAFHAFGYKYVLPQVGAYRLTASSAAMRFSFVSVDRSTFPPSLLTGEYVKSQVTGKLARWCLNPGTGLLEGAGVFRPAQAFVANQDRMQGALSWRGRTWLSCSSQKMRGSKNYGRLYYTAPFRPSTAHDWVYGPEDLTLTPSKGNLWSLSEFPGSRVVFAVKLSVYRHRAQRVSLLQALRGMPFAFSIWLF